MKRFFTKLRNSMVTLEYTEADFAFGSPASNVVKTGSINVLGAQSLTLCQKSSVSSLFSILDADASTKLGIDVAIYTSSGATSNVKTLDLSTLALNNIKLKVDGQGSDPTTTFLLRVNKLG